MKGIDGILARAGRSETRTGNEVELDFDSIISGTGIVMTMPNATAGAEFLSLKSGSGDTEVFVFNYDGSMTMAAGLTVSAGGAAVTGNVVVTTGEFTGDLDEDNTIGGSDLRDGQYAIDRERRYQEYMEDFTQRGLSGVSSFVYTQESGTTNLWGLRATDPLGVVLLSGVSDVAPGAISVQHEVPFVTITNNKKYYFESRFKCWRFNLGEFFIGLCNVDVALAGAGNRGTPTCDDFIGFQSPGTSLKWHMIVGTAAAADKNSATSTPNVATGVTGTYMRLGFSVDTTGTGTTIVTPYVDGVAGSAPTDMGAGTGSSTPSNTALTITSAVSMNQGGVPAMLIDYINVVQER